MSLNASGHFNIIKDPAKLTTPCEWFDFDNPPFNPAEFAQQLVHSMHFHSGIGLAANQVGVNYRIFSMRGNPNYVFFNPRIVANSDKDIVLEEACLSFPGLVVKVKRPETVRVRYVLPNGETTTSQFTGISARCVQHECDHLDGLLFYNKASKFHRDQAFRKWKHFINNPIIRK